jgi:M6 family metalloprotease-like protein
MTGGDMKKHLNFLIAILIIVSNRNLNAAPFDTGMIELQQPDETTFTGRIWGDEFIWWAETKDGYRFVETFDGWYYYATLDENGEYAPTENKVGIDEPPSESYQLERTQSRLEDIAEEIQQFNEQIEINRQWFEQLQDQAQGQAVTLKVGIILIEFTDTTHFTASYRPEGYTNADFEDMLFSENGVWYDTSGTTPHPENEKIYGSFKEYWHQMSRGKLKIEGGIANPDNDHNGVPDWLTADSTKQFYYNLKVTEWDSLARTAIRKALEAEYIDTTNKNADNYFDKLVIVYADEVRWGGALKVNGQRVGGKYIQLAERSSERLRFSTDWTFTHMGVYAHEFGHNLGFWDEYHDPYSENPMPVDGNGTDIFNFCLMSWGLYNGPEFKGECPATLSPFYRIEKDWVNPVLLEDDSTNFIVEYNYLNPKFFRINPIDATEDEHFIIETKKRQGFDLFIPDNPADTVDQPGRLLVWHHNIQPDPYSFEVDRILIKPADNNFDRESQLSDFFPAEFVPDYQDLNDITEPASTLGKIYEVPQFSNERPSHVALNGIQKLTNGNTLIEEIKLHYPLPITNNNSGNWQTVSVPGVPDDYSATSVFPSLVDNTIYKYQTSYILVTTLENGPGYYAKFPASPQTIIHDGNPIEYLEVPLNNGWNLTGSISYEIPVTNLCTVPPCILTGDIYYYDGGYNWMSEEDSLKPGIGYWIKTESAGDLILDGFGELCCEELEKLNSFPQINFSEMDKFIITDSSGYSQTLYVTNIDIDTAMRNVDREFPPFFDQLDFDSRFEYNEYVKKVSADSGEIDLNILVHTNSFPVSLAWEINPENGISYSFISDSGMGKISDIKSTHSSISFNKLENKRIQLKASTSGNSFYSIPTEYTLYQNFPNPFNPTTTIKYDLPNTGIAELIVYDILGRKVRTLLNENQQAGRYEISFNATGLASGVYIYQLRAQDFISTRKMILLK